MTYPPFDVIVLANSDAMMTTVEFHRPSVISASLFHRNKKMSVEEQVTNISIDAQRHIVDSLLT
jgi:uncharacterized protein YlxW (UPF0749 family)